jgi:hypothetical protein
VRVLLLVPQPCLLCAALAQHLGAVAAGPAALFAVRDACAAQVLGCGVEESRSGARVAAPAALIAARRLRGAWVRVLLVPRHCLLRATLEMRLGAGAAGPAALFAARDA